MSYIYGIRRKDSKKNTIKYGSTTNFNNRIKAYITSECDFDNNSHEIVLYHITNKKFTCYEIDTILKKTCKEIGYPYKKFNGTGGTEHYHFTTYGKIEEFLENIGVKFVKEMVDINVMRSLTTDITKNDTKKTKSKDTKGLKNLKNFEVSINKNGKFKVGNTTYSSRKILVGTVHTCKICNYRTKHSGNYMKHLQTKKHLKKKNGNKKAIKKFICGRCNKSFTRKNNLKRHLDKSCKKKEDIIVVECPPNHGDKKIDKKICIYCKNKFARNDSCKRHMKVCKAKSVYLENQKLHEKLQKKNIAELKAINICKENNNMLKTITKNS